jgi:hypothetical protein
MTIDEARFARYSRHRVAASLADQEFAALARAQARPA